MNVAEVGEAVGTDVGVVKKCLLLWMFEVLEFMQVSVWSDCFRCWEFMIQVQVELNMLYAF